MPDHVLSLSARSEDVPQLIARSRVLVTDYSPIAHDAAFIDRPVVYYQFDRERALGDADPESTHYFAYGRDGFGPVTETCDEAIEAIAEALELGPEPKQEYAARAEAAFPRRDGRSSQRAFKAIMRSLRRVPAQTVERSRPSQ